MFVSLYCVSYNLRFNVHSVMIGLMCGATASLAIWTSGSPRSSLAIDAFSADLMGTSWKNFVTSLFFVEH